MKLLPVVLFTLLCCAGFGQARLIINGGIVLLNNGAVLVVDNPGNLAITQTGSGYISSEAINNIVIWSVGAGNGNTYSIPFGNVSGILPLQFSAASGSADGKMVLSTYPTPTWKNSDFLPPGVTNVNRDGMDNSAKVIDRFWQIKPQGYTTRPALTNVVFTYADAAYSAPNTIIESNLIPQRWNNVTLAWGDYFPSSVINTINNTVTLPAVPGNQLYDWWTLVDASFALPVTLVNFTASVRNKTVVTNWQTTAENNSHYFEVWRSTDQRNFNAIGRLAAAGTSSALLNYTLTDADPYDGISYYKLKSVDMDGKYAWSATVKIFISKQALVSLSPNPATAFISLSVSSGMADRKPTAYIYDSKGSLVQSFRITTAYQPVNISFLPPGLYRIQFMYNEKPQTLSFIKK